MACNVVKNALFTNQLDAATAIGRSQVKLGKGIGSANFTTTKNNIPGIKMQLATDDPKKTKKPTNEGKFGKFGGKFVPESLIACLAKLEAEFNLVLNDSKFQVPKLKLNLNFFCS